MKLKINKNLSVIMVISLFFGIGEITFECFDIGVNAAESFVYEHDPRMNPSPMNDIWEDETAVYGFRPNETGSLKQYASYV